LPDLSRKAAAVVWRLIGALPFDRQPVQVFEQHR
jgi:hypothetical protein